MSKVIPKVRASKASVKSTIASLQFGAQEALSASAPKSVLSIPSVIRHGPMTIQNLSQAMNTINNNNKDKDDIHEQNRIPAAAIQQVGGTRRIFILNKNFTKEELDGLAYRIQVLAKNTSLNSILMANHTPNDDDEEDDLLLPSSVLELERNSHRSVQNNDDYDYQLPSSIIAHFSTGYDPHYLHKLHPTQQRSYLTSLQNLALSIKGQHTSESSNYYTKIPLITIPHGQIYDSGYALTMGSYTLATSSSSYQLLNGYRGLSLDPIGLSYLLPRLGWEWNQPCRNYSMALGLVLALTGWKVQGSDLVETGLATHYLGDYSDFEDKASTLEKALSELPPYSSRIGLGTKPKSYYGQQNNGNTTSTNNTTAHGKIRNQAVANLLLNICEYDAAGQEIFDATTATSFERHIFRQDPSLVLEHERNHILEHRNSKLVNVAATLQHVFEDETSVYGIMERLREISSNSSSTATTLQQEEELEDERQVGHLAKDLLNNMEKQSPLALSVIYKLMERGGKDVESSLETCMERELNVQCKLLQGEDFQNWIKSGEKEMEFRGWKHTSVKDVTEDEVLELLG